MRSSWEKGVAVGSLVGAVALGTLIVADTAAMPAVPAIKGGGYGAEAVTVALRVAFNSGPLVLFSIALLFGGRELLAGVAVFAAILAIFYRLALVSSLTVPASVPLRGFAILESGCQSGVSAVVLFTAVKGVQRRPVRQTNASIPGATAVPGVPVTRALAVGSGLLAFLEAIATVNTNLVYFNPPTSWSTFLIADLLATIPWVVAIALGAAAAWALAKAARGDGADRVKAVGYAKMGFGGAIPLLLFGFFWFSLGVGFLGGKSDAHVLSANIAGISMLAAMLLNIVLLVVAFLAGRRRRSAPTAPASA